MNYSTVSFLAAIAVSPIWWIVLAAFLIGNGRRAPNPLDLGVVTTLAGYGAVVLWSAGSRALSLREPIGLILLAIPILLVLARRSRLRYDPMAASYAAMLFAALLGGAIVGMGYGYWFVTTID